MKKILIAVATLLIGGYANAQDSKPPHTSIGTRNTYADSPATKTHTITKQPNTKKQTTPVNKSYKNNSDTSKKGKK